MRKHSVKSQAILWCISLALCLVFPTASHAIPAFARQYQTSCTTCHSDFPKLNDFGKAFKDAGFKFPADDETFLKVPPVMLGAPAQKDLFPRSVWPGTIPGMPPIGLRMNTFFQKTSGNRGKFDSLVPAGTVPPFVPKTDFSTGLFSIFTAGNFGSDIAFWVDSDLNVAGDNASGGLGDAYLKFVNLGRLLKMRKDALSMRVGRFELDLPFSQARNINISGYDIFDQANFGATNPAFAFQNNVNNQLTLADAMNGIEFSGGHQYGGYHYSIAFVDQNTNGVSQSANGSSFVPSPAGFASDSNFKDIYTRFSYRFNLEKDPASRNAVQAAGASGPRDHTFVNLGTYYFYGRSVQRFSGENLLGDPVVLTAREPFYRVGGDFSVNYRAFNVYGLFMYGHDNNQLPVDITGTPVPLPITGVPSTTVGFIHGRPATFTGGFIQADYLVHPWLMTLLRWDAVNSGPDRINGLAQSVDTPFVLPFHQTRNRITPGVQFLIHANIKASFEYQFRPQQFVTVITNPITGLPIATQPFRTNTAVVALEWVY
ncbi:MAG TPA: hypothetical protein VEW69_02390 [Alphaproteobacteria bacterium]|nr:hypothetical protein [Alphaproteobacteria bacterium]